MISVQEFARRLSDLGPENVTRHDVEDLADSAGVRIDPARGIDAGQAQQLLDLVSPSAPVSAAAMVASPWPPPADVRPTVTPMVFSSPGAVDAPADPETQPRRSGRAPTERPRSRRTR
ncbi:hypothetical protein [Actinoplanes missouriensis]|uniref:hypothetical protein n=1 Tax=Actinoplanes missouriensis TaxID=1866 RepID=UPI0012FC19E6|nr:hypothetical protein [Actinoplanes missouriensis]